MSTIQQMQVGDAIYRVEFSSMKELALMIRPEHRSQGIQNIIQTGGCYAINLSPESIKIAADAVAEEYRSEILATPPGFMICLVQDFIQFLSKEELEAILYHEVGHIQAGHLDPVNTQGLSGILISLDNEIQADDFMASKTDPKYLFSGIQKVLANISDFIYNAAKRKGHVFDPYASFEEMMHDPHLVARRQRFGL